MIGAIFVATEADLALGGGRIFVTGMAGRARAVLGLRVQAWKILNLMTGRAGRHAGRSLWTVGTVAGHATGADLAVRALLFRAVAVGARFLHR
jgi:hypothetical protein